MKKYFYFSIITALAILRTSADDTKTNEFGITTNKIQMSISIAEINKKININQPFNLLICIKNESTNELFHGHYTYSNDHDLSFVVIAPSGKDISPEFSKDQEVVAISGASILAYPNQIKKIQYNLSSTCNFNEVGVYTIVAKQKGYLGTNQIPFTVTSNPLSVNVVGSKKKP